MKTQCLFPLKRSTELQTCSLNLVDRNVSKSEDILSWRKQLKNVSQNHLQVSKDQRGGKRRGESEVICVSPIPPRDIVPVLKHGKKLTLGKKVSTAFKLAEHIFLIHFLITKLLLHYTYTKGKPTNGSSEKWENTYPLDEPRVLERSQEMRRREI